MSSNPRRSSRASALIGTMRPTSPRAVSVAVPLVSLERVICQALLSLTRWDAANDSSREIAEAEVRKKRGAK